MKREEAVEGWIIDRETTPEPSHDALADNRDRREQIGDHGSTPKAHLPPGKNIAHERCRHHQKEDDHTQHPKELSWRLVRAIIEAAENMDVDNNEEERCAIRMSIADQPAKIDVTHDMFDAGKGVIDMRGVVHCQNNAGQNLKDQSQACKRAKIPPIAQVLWAGILAANHMVHGAEDRQAVLDPTDHRICVIGVTGACAHRISTLSISCRDSFSRCEPLYH